MQRSLNHDDGGMAMECTNGQCMLWAVLALTRLDGKISTQLEAGELFAVSGDGCARRLRHAIDSIAVHFYNPDLQHGVVVWDEEALADIR